MNLLNSYRIKQRRDAKQILQKIESANGKVLVIHYSCESFYGKAGYTPRVTSIGILNRENNEAIIFSLHLSAQILKKDLVNLSNENLDEVEKSMLDEFSKYVHDHMNYIWIHWHMRSASYGFQAISNRYRILGGKEINIPDINKIDLPEILGKLFTYGFEANEPHGQLLNLANRNKISTRDALPGAEEAIAFENKEYLKLHMSTLRKVEIIDRLLTTYQNDKIKHNAKVKDIYDLSIPGLINLVKESPVLLLIWSIVIFVIG
ncbi:MAG: hypothetical protein RIR73_1792, partial [Chloroflexota bacterium]